jgi:peptide deformylase
VVGLRELSPLFPPTGTFPKGGVDRKRAFAYLHRMPKLPIIKLPDPILREKSLPVETIDADVRAFLNDMLETMYGAPGIGLAAVQVGLLRRMFVIDPVRGEEEPKRPMMLINPEIVSKGGTPRLHEEGCLSIPEMYAEVERPALVRVRYVDIEGNQREEDFQDLLATVVQHEIDHLNGVLFIDHLSRLKRDVLVKKYHKAQREKAEQL